LGDQIAQRIEETKTAGGPWAWSLGRLGSRVPVYGSAHNVVPPPIAKKWLDVLLQIGLKKVDGSAFAAAQIARKSGDRLHDLDEAVRTKLLESLRGAEAPDTWIQMVSEVTVLKTADEARALGDTLPIGLQLAK
jgi:hypothetical protein